MQQIQAAVDAKRAGEVTQGLMEATMEREQSRKGQQEREKREVAEGRLKAMLELKQSIVASKVRLCMCALGSSLLIVVSLSKDSTQQKSINSISTEH